MKQIIALLVTGFALAAMPVQGAAPGSGTAPAKKTMAQDGRFHQIHAKKLAMDCGTCHKPEQGSVILQVSRANAVDRELCLACHKYGSKPAWYGVVTR